MLTQRLRAGLHSFAASRLGEGGLSFPGTAVPGIPMPPLCGWSMGAGLEHGCKTGAWVQEKGRRSHRATAGVVSTRWCRLGLEFQLHGELNLARSALSVYAGTEAEAQAVRLRVGGSVGGAVAAVENAIEWNTGAVEVCNVEDVEECDAGFQLNPFLEFVRPAQSEIESLQPCLSHGAGGRQLQGTVWVSAAGNVAPDHAAQLLQVGEQDQALADEHLSCG